MSAQTFSITPATHVLGSAPEPLPHAPLPTSFCNLCEGQASIPSGRRGGP
jgi:hypothetical protein